MQSIPELSEAAEAAEAAAGSQDEGARQQSPRRTDLSTSTAVGSEGFATPPRGARFRSQIPIERKTPQMLRNLGEHLTMCSDDELMRVHAAVSNEYSGGWVASPGRTSLVGVGLPGVIVHDSRYTKECAPTNSRAQNSMPQGSGRERGRLR